MSEAANLYADALAWAKAQKITLPDEYYGAISAATRNRSFSVAGLAQLDALQAVHKSLIDALASGKTQREWAKALLADPTAAQMLAMPAHRLDNIFRTNLQTGYMRGIARQQESPASLKRRPFFQYDAINDSRTRPSHMAMDNFIAPADDGVWKIWTPPSGYRCRCIRIALSAAEARARGWNGSTQPVPSNPDAGWGHHPLEGDGWEGLKQAYAERLDLCNLHPALLAKKHNAQPLWCRVGDVRDKALLLQQWTEREGKLPAPKPLVIHPLRFTTAEDAFSQFMREFSRSGDLSTEFDLPNGERLLIDESLFRDSDGEWKITKRGRDTWLLYLAELIKHPQEIWLHPLTNSDKLYLFGRYQRGRELLEAMVVFSRKSENGVWEGTTAYVSDRDDYLEPKRRKLIKEGGTVVWMEM